MRALMVGLITFALAAAPTPGLASSQDKKAPGPPPTTAPPTPLPDAPPPPSESPQAAKQEPAQKGQWVHTEQYGWVWMPYDEAYTHLSDDGNPPSMYVYYPATSSWCWVVAPWLWGWGPEPYFGVYGTAFYGWYGYGLGRWGGYHGAYANYGWSSCGYWHGGHWNGVQGGRPLTHPWGSQRALSSDHYRGYGGASARVGATGYRGYGDRSMSGHGAGSRSGGSVVGRGYGGSSGRGGASMGGGGGASRGGSMGGGARGGGGRR